jgi:hypothetical protein
MTNPFAPLSALAAILSEWLTSRDTCQIPMPPLEHLFCHMDELRDGLAFC